MATGIIDIVKRAAMDAVRNEQMCDLRYGTVVSTLPIRVQITNQLTIPSALLIVPKSLTDHTLSITTEDGQKTITVHNALKVGDKVALLRKQGGQSYFILDRI